MHRAQDVYRLPGTVADVRHLPFADGSIPYVVCSETLEHLVNPLQALQELNRICGKVLLLTIPANWKHGAQDSFQEPDPSRLFEHINEFTPAGLRRALGDDIHIQGARSLLRGFNRLQEALVNRGGGSTAIIQLLVWFNHMLSRIFPHQTAHFVVLKFQRPVHHGNAGRLPSQLRRQIRLLHALFHTNAVPPLHLSPAGNGEPVTVRAEH